MAPAHPPTQDEDHWKADRLDLAKLEYDLVRDSIQDCDIMLCRGGRLLHKSIRFFTGGYWNHAALVGWWNGNLMVLEAGEKGTTCFPLSHLVKTYPGEVAIARYSHGVGLTYGQSVTILRAAIDDLGLSYDTWLLPRLALRKVLGRLGYKGKQPENGRRYCSEFVQRAFRAGGIDFCADDQGVISPSSIADNRDVAMIGRFT